VWELPVVPEVCSGIGALFGGCALGAAAEALERTTGRPLVWGVAQFLSFVRPPEVVEVVVTPLVEGGRFTQARVVGTSNGTDIFHVSATLGRRDSDLSGAWAIPPETLPPEQCPPRERPPRFVGTVMDRVETRLVADPEGRREPGTVAPGRSGFWVRIPDLECSSAALGLVGDFVPAGISFALGERAGGQSLDNSVRVLQLAPSEWYLVDVRIHGVEHGVAHGLAHMWNERGVLLGTATQTTVVRRF
jgi:acyl-CoA thioesterase II